MVWVLVAAALAASPRSAIPGLAAALPAPVTTAAWAAGVEEAVVRAPSWAARRAVITGELATADGERAGRLGQALAVLASLERTGRTDPSIVRLFLRASLADDATVRAAAVDAAMRAGDPPLAVSTGAGAAPVSTASTAPVAPAPVVRARRRINGRTEGDPGPGAQGARREHARRHVTDERRRDPESRGGRMPRFFCGVP